MPDYNTVKRPPNYGNDDYVLRALYRLLGKHFSPRRNKSPSPYNNRPVNRGFGKAAGSKGPSGPRSSYAPRSYQPSFGHGQGGSGFTVPKKPEPSYARESRPYTQSLPQPRTEPDIEELFRRLEQRFDGRLVEQVMAKLDVESNAVEAALKTNPTDEPSVESKEASADAGESPDAKQDVEKSSVENVKPEPSEPEPLDDLELDDLEWLDEEMHGLVVEAENGEPAFVTLEALEAGLEQTQDVPEAGQSDLVRPEMETVPLEPLVEVDPLKQLEPGVAELEEEVEDGEAESL